jgi:hypothetical protein
MKPTIENEAQGTTELLQCELGSVISCLHQPPDPIDGTIAGPTHGQRNASLGVVYLFPTGGEGYLSDVDRNIAHAYEHAACLRRGINGVTRRLADIERQGRQAQIYLNRAMRRGGGTLTLRDHRILLSMIARITDMVDYAQNGDDLGQHHPEVALRTDVLTADDAATNGEGGGDAKTD